MDSAGVAHLVWYEWDAGEIWYNAGTPGSWPDPVLLSTQSDYGQYEPQIAVGPEGKAHVVWYDYEETENYYRAYYAGNPGGAWTDPVPLSHQDGWDSYRPKIALDRDGNPHVVWDDYDGMTQQDDIWYSADIGQRIVKAAVQGGHGAVDPELQAVPIGGTATVSLVPDEGYRTGSVTDNGAAVEPTPEGAYTIENITEYHEVAVTFVPAAADWYLAEGATAGDFETWILVQNPSPDPVDVDLTFMTSEGLVPGPQDVTIAGDSRKSFLVNSYVIDYDVSTRVQATGGNVICERAMYGGGRTWAHDSIGYAP